MPKPPLAPVSPWPPIRVFGSRKGSPNRAKRKRRNMRETPACFEGAPNRRVRLTEISLIILIVLAVGLWLYVLVSVPGCAAPGQRAEGLAEQQQGLVNAAELAEQTGAKIAGVLAEYRKQDNRQIVNELWPWMARSIAIAAILAVALTIVLVVYIRRHSYKVQKPEYERRKKATRQPGDEAAGG